MVRIYLKSAFNYLYHHKIFSLINIIGLAISLSLCFFIIQYIKFELSYDTYNKNAKNIYRVVTDVTTGTGIDYESAPMPLAPAMLQEFPEVKAATRILLDNIIVQKDENTYQEEEIAYADSSLFSVFTISLIEGNAATALNAPYKVVLSQTASKKYFGSENPLGKTVTLDGKFPAVVTGVMEDIPYNSQFRTDVLISLSTLLEEWNPSRQTNWKRFGVYTYLLLPDNYNSDKLTSKLSAFVNEHFDQTNAKYKVSIDPLLSVYLHGKPRGTRTGTITTGNLNDIFILSLISVFVLIIAAINFINLATAFSLYRAKEIAIRKVNGATKTQLVIQFLSDAIVISLIAFFISVILIFCLVPAFNSLANNTIITYKTLFSVQLLLLFAIAFSVGLLSGLYPAFFLASLKPTASLKGNYITNAAGALTRKALVVTQFSISIIMIIATIVVYTQLNYMQNRNLGFKKNNLLVIDFHFDERIVNHIDLVKQELKKIPGVNEVSMSFYTPGKANFKVLTALENKNGQLQTSLMDAYFVDYDFLKQYDIKLVAGRAFSTLIPSDSTQAMLINEAAVKSMGFKNPNDAVGKYYKQAGDSGFVIGVVKDFHFHSYKEEVQPLTFQLGHSATFLSLSYTSKNINQTVSNIQSVWKTLAPGLPLIYFFENDAYNHQYADDERFGRLFICFASLLIGISCMGLLGLCAFSTYQRTKEMGIRKVLGANSFHVAWALSINFFKPIIIAMIIACPVAWILMNQWLQNNYAYRISVDWWMLIAANAIALVIATLTISYYIIKSLKTNPIKSLRQE